VGREGRRYLLADVNQLSAWARLPGTVGYQQRYVLDRCGYLQSLTGL
jgi:hypothetical protein